MTHFLYLIGTALCLSICFAVFSSGDTNEKIKYGLKTFGQFVGISLIMAWVFYFLPW